MGILLFALIIAERISRAPASFLAPLTTETICTTFLARIGDWRLATQVVVLDVELVFQLQSRQDTDAMRVLFFGYTV